MAGNRTQMENWLNECKKVRRPCWKPESYWVLSIDGYRRILYSDGTPARVHMNQLDANDWEVFEEFGKNLSDKISNAQLFRYLRLDDVKEEVGRVIENLKKAKGHDGKVELKYALKIIKKRFGDRLVR